jgi:hypothetical protein
VSKRIRPRYFKSFVAGVSVVLAAALPAARAAAVDGTAGDQAETPTMPAEDDGSGSQSPAASGNQTAALLMDGVSARGPRTRASMAALGGYDSVRGAALFQSRVEVHLIGPLTLMGAVVLANGDQNTVQPRIGLKLQLLSQGSHGFDLAVGGGYRRDRYTQDDGMVEAFVAAGRQLGRLSLLANVVVGSDLEGDDRKGDVRLSAMRGFGRSLQLGLGVSGELDLASFDPRRGARADSVYEIVGGPMGSYGLGPWALLIEVGPSVVKTDRVRTGYLTLGGVGTVF